MGVNVFDLEAGDDLALRTIDAIEKFYHSLGVDTQFTEYETNKDDAIESVIKQLEAHGMTKLGECGAITPDVSRQILANAIA
ncbi:hypothetical protein HCZ42_06865 [Vibrio hepatarius]|nr:hypothetical protein [Vibrio hepatarius]